jgi:hypothetical protein
MKPIYVLQQVNDGVASNVFEYYFEDAVAAHTSAKRMKAQSLEELPQYVDSIDIVVKMLTLGILKE